MSEISRKSNEDIKSYKLRLFRNKDLYNLNSKEISDLINKETENNFNESTYRKWFTAYEEGFQDALKEIKLGGVATRILSISDSHVPFQLPIESFKDYRNQVDIFQFNGDIIDMQAISKFPKSYRVSVMEEMIQGRQYIIDLIEYIQPKKVVVTYGNHELRFQAYLSKNLDSDLLELMPKTALDLIFVDGFNHYDKRNKTKVWYEPLKKVFDNIEINYTEDWYCQIGKTIFCHPSAFNCQIMKTAEKAMYWFRNEGFDFSSLVMAHTHRIGEYTIGNTTIYEQGCVCDTKKQHYSDGRLTYSQKEGFIFICQDKDGNVIKDKTKLVVLN